MIFYYVLSDPSHKYRVGTLLKDVEARVAGFAGVALIPIDTGIFQVRSALSGFFRSDFGLGKQLPNTAGPVAPSALFVVPQASVLHWRACIQFDNPGLMYGQLRLTNDSSQFGLKLGIQSEPVDLGRYAESVSHDGSSNRTIVIGGQSVIAPPPDGMLGLALWGTGGGRLLWVAVSQTLKSTGDYVINPDAPQDTEVATVQVASEPVKLEKVVLKKG